MTEVNEVNEGSGRKTTELNPYEVCHVSIENATPDPLKIVEYACQLTMKQFPGNVKGRKSLIRFLLKANHTSVFEHVNYTIVFNNVSRSFLAQITRHRHASFTSGSQHYQNYKDYAFRCSAHVLTDKSKTMLMTNGLESCMFYYDLLIKDGVPHHEARQILPNGMEVRLMMTVNARSLINMLNLRLCQRNTEEMRVVMVLLHTELMKHFPELFKLVGADCYMSKCKQGKMSCDR